MKYPLILMLALSALACKSPDTDIKTPEFKNPAADIDVEKIVEEALQSCNNTDQGEDAEGTLVINGSIRMTRVFQHVQHLNCEGEVVSEGKEIQMHPRGLMTFLAAETAKEDVVSAKITNRRTCQTRSNKAVENEDKVIQLVLPLPTGGVVEYPADAPIVQKNGRLQFAISDVTNWFTGIDGSLSVREGLNKIDIEMQTACATENCEKITETLNLEVAIDEVVWEDTKTISDCKTETK